MNKIENSSLFKEIIEDLKMQNFNRALNKTKLIAEEYPNENLILKLFAKIYFNKNDWNKAIYYYEKNLIFDEEKFKIYINIGVALFKLGKIHKSIEAFKKSIEDNPKSELAHNNIGVSYLELGMFEKATEHFVFVLNQNSENYTAQNNLINIFNYNKPKNVNDHPLIEINYKIQKLNYDEITEEFNDNYLKKIFKKSNNLIKNFKKNLISNETQIFRKNSENLNCNRHFKVFNEFNIIPKYCFECYKVQINLKSVVDLIKLFLIFDKLNLENNNTRKCLVELRDKVKGNYKGYIYCKGSSEASHIKTQINEIITKKNLNVLKIDIKHGCTEFYKSYPDFEKINFNGDQKMKYNKNWSNKEKIIDLREPQRIKIDKKIWSKTIGGINLSDILILNNWISYAHILGDFSYRNIYDDKINQRFVNQIIKNQLEFRKREL
tara:strand:- start:1368 stop:2675 length:1308 start_codon:yes stop_codon:yes gene_type:complete